MKVRVWPRNAIASVFGVLTLWIGGAVGAPSSFAFEKFFENSTSQQPLLNLIQNTKKTLDIEVYEMEDPSVQDAIRKALRRGVRVRVIQEPSPVGEKCNLFDVSTPSNDPTCESERKLVRDIRAAGGVYVPFVTRELCRFKGTKCFQHGKLVISDQQYAFLSTGNFNSTSLCNRAAKPAKCNRDYSVLVWDAPSVRTFRRVFELDLKGKEYDLKSIVDHQDAQKVTVSPYSEKPLFDLIRSAKHLVQIQNQYLNDPEMNQLLIETAQRGVKVYVMVASACSFGKPDSGDIQRWTKTYGAFEQAGIRVRTFSSQMKVGGLPGYLHAKAILVDSVQGWVGSVNGSESGINNNREFGVMLRTESEALRLGAFLKSDFNSPDSQTWQESLQCRKDPRALAVQ